MAERRIIGLDLGIASEHTVRVLTGDGRMVAKRKAVPTAESLTTLEQAALEGAAPGTVLEVVMEPTGPAWLPVAVFFDRRGHRVFRVPSAVAHDMRRVFSRHAKSNSIDAEAWPGWPSSPPKSSGLSRWAASMRPPSTAGSGPVTGSPKRPVSTRSGSRTWCASCCP